MSEHKAHIVSYKRNLLVWIDLLILTFVTVEIAQFDFQNLTIVVALLVATVKTVLVGYHFMHLKFETRFFTFMVILTMIVFIAVLIFLFLDYSHR